MKKKIKTSDLNLSPKPIGSPIPSDDGKTGEDQAQETKSITVRPTDQDNCLVTFACPNTMDCPMTRGGCVTGNGCFATQGTCIDTARCIPYTKNANECVTDNECDTVACMDTTPESPCLETQVPICAISATVCEHETVDYFTCQETSNCESSDTSCEETSNDCGK